MSISRRSFLGGLTAASLASFVDRGTRPRAQGREGGGPQVDARKLQERIEALSLFGRPSGGTFADGVSRVAYSDADVEGRQYVIGLMKAAGLDPRIDPAGNIFGTRAGADPKLPPILFGSHIDSVPNGGNFDGDLGSLSALCVMEALAAAQIQTRHPLVPHPATRDPRSDETEYIARRRWHRGRFFYGAQSPFSSWTRSPASTPNCDPGLTGERVL